MQDFRYVGLDISLKQRALGDIHFCFLSQLAYNSEILSKFVQQIIYPNILKKKSMKIKSFVVLLALGLSACSGG